MDVSVLGIDLAKSVFQLHGVDRRGKAVLSKRLSRSQLPVVVANLPKCLVGMEACASAHYWARELQKLGHEVRLMSPQFVKPYVKSNKNDRADAEAIAEAVTRPNMRFVAVKTIEQQDVQALHRVRERLVGTRTALINELRGLLGEYGVVLPQGAQRLRAKISDALENATSQGLITQMSRQTFDELLGELHELDERVERMDQRIKAIHRAHPVCQRLAEIPGVGPLTATAIVSAVGDPSMFKNGRAMSAWLGLVPRQHSSGGKEVLLGISKRGDTYLRKLLIHGARTVVRWRDRHPEDRQTRWLKVLVERRGVNRATVALANKNARRIWVLMAHEVEYDPAA